MNNNEAIINSYHTNESNTNNSYAQSRILQLFPTLQDAKKQGVKPCSQGIFIQYFDIHGNPLMFLPVKHRKRPEEKDDPKAARPTLYRYEKAKAQDQFNPYDDTAKHLAEPYGRIRLKPELVKGKKKYDCPSTFNADFFEGFLSNKIMRKNFSAKKQTQFLTLTEGEFKGIYAGEHDMTCGTYSGITHFKLADDLKEYLTTCRPQNIILNYDNDAQNLSKSALQTIANKRPRDFYNSAMKITRDLFEFTKGIKGYNPNIFYVQINDSKNKGLDDLLINHKGQEQDVINALYTLENSKYFTVIKLNKNSYQQDLLQHFNIDTPFRFYSFHTNNIKEKQFTFKHSTGDLGVYQYDNKKEALQTLKAPHDITPSKTYFLNQNERVSDVANDLVQQIIKHKKIDLKGCCNVGKNFACVNVIAPTLKRITGLSTMLVCPLNALTKKQGEQYNIKYLTGSSTQEEIQEAIHETVFVANHHAARKIAKYCLEHNIMLNVFKDESHTLGLGMSYKSDIITKLVQEIEKIAFTQINMSATPLQYYSQINYTRLEITKNQKPEFVNRIFYTEKKEAVILEHIQKTDFSDGKLLLIKLQSKKGLKKIKKTLIKKYGFSEDEIRLMISEQQVKESAFYQKLLAANEKEESFDTKVKIVLCTNFINEGVDIYTSRIVECVNVEINSLFNYKDFVQFIGRPRTYKQKIIYSYHYQPKSQRETFAFDAQYEFNKLKNYYEESAKRANMILSSNDENCLLRKEIVKEKVIKLKTQNSHLQNALYFDIEQDKYMVNYEYIMGIVESYKVSSMTTLQAYDLMTSTHTFIKVLDQNTDKDTDKTITEAERKNDITEEQKEAITTNLEEITKEEQKKEKEAETKIIDLFKKDYLTFLLAVVFNNRENQKLNGSIFKHFPQLDKANPRYKEIEAHALELKSKETLFKEYPNLAEKFCNNLIKFLDVYFDLDTAFEQIIITDEDGKHYFRSHQNLAVFIDKYKTILLKELARKGVKILTLDQKEEGLNFLALERNLQQILNDNNGTITPKQIHKITQKIGCFTHYTQQKAVKLFNVLFKAKRNTKGFYNCVQKNTLETLLIGQNINVDKTYLNFHNSLIIIGQTMTELDISCLFLSI